MDFYFKYDYFTYPCEAPQYCTCREHARELQNVLCRGREPESGGGGSSTLFVINFMSTSTVTKSEDSQFTYVFPCFLVETFRYFIPRVVSF